jgi:transcriptional regulator with XRE-family HTH domain
MPAKPRNVIGRTLKLLRINRGVSLADAGQTTGIPWTRLSAIERGLLYPDEDTALAIILRLKFSLTEWSQALSLASSAPAVTDTRHPPLKVRPAQPRPKRAWSKEEERSRAARLLILGIVLPALEAQDGHPRLPARKRRPARSRGHLSRPRRRSVGGR